MYRILNRVDLSDIVHLFVIEAPEVAQKAHPGQFIIIRLDEKGRASPLYFRGLGSPGRYYHYGLPGSRRHYPPSGPPDAGDAVEIW